MVTHEPRLFIFDDRPTRAAVIDAVKAALDDEGLALRQGCWGRVQLTIDGDGRFVATVPASVITPQVAR